MGLIRPSEGLSEEEVRRPTFMSECSRSRTVLPPSFLAERAAPPPAEQRPAFRPAGRPEPAAPKPAPAEPVNATPAPPPPPAAPSPAVVEAAVRAATEAESRLWAERVGRAIEALRAHSGRLAEEARTDALEIGFQVARRILETEVSSNVSSLVSLVRSAVKKAGECRELHVRVGVPDFQALETSLEQEAGGELWVAKVELVPDPTLQRGDVVVETEFGTVDGRLETRLQETKQAVASALGMRRS